MERSEHVHSNQLKDRIDSVVEKGSVFLFGDDISPLAEALKRIDVRVHRVLTGCHPFAIVGDTNPRMEQYLQDCNAVPILAQIKKNFSNMLSRDKMQYESNYMLNAHPRATEVDDCNRSDYLVIYFSGLCRELRCVGNTVYSLYGKRGEFAFTEEIRGIEPISVPFPRMFNWSYYVKLFADTCLYNYDPSHIILVRANPSEWCLDGTNILLTETSLAEIRVCIQRVEDEFSAIAHCHIIDDLSCWIRDKDNLGICQTSAFAWEKAAESICAIMREEKKDTLQSSLEICPYSQPILRRLYHRLNQKTRAQLAEEMKTYDEEAEAVIGESFLEQQESGIYVDISRLEFFLHRDGYGLTDALRNTLPEDIDISLFNIYTAYFRMDISDVIAVFALHEKMADEGRLSKIIQHICENQECLPLVAMQAFMEKNRQYLLDYPYLGEELKSNLRHDWAAERKLSFIKISKELAICFQSRQTALISRLHWGNVVPEVKRIVGQGMRCGIKELEPLSKHWGFYLERAKAGLGNVPLHVTVDSSEEFLLSLVFMDYEKILESENAMISLGDYMDANHEKWSTAGYRVKCNLEILLDSRTKIFHLHSGLSDQLNYYFFSKMIQEKSGCLPLYDDLYAKHLHAFNGVELEKLISEDKKDFRSRCISNIVSKQLYSGYSRKMSLADLLYTNGWDNLICVVARGEASWSTFPRKSMCLYVNESTKDVWETAKHGVFKWYHWHRQYHEFAEDYDDIHRWIRFPEFEDEANREVAQEMLDCDAVVLHVRCGDYISAMKRNPNLSFYSGCIQKLLAIQDYPNKKYFIFSDDMQYIKEHYSELGLDLVDKADVRYVDHNKRETSFWDMKLISLGKVILVGNGGFGAKAVLLSRRKEIAISQLPIVNVIWEQHGWKNKHVLA